MDPDLDWNNLTPALKAKSLADQAAEARREGHDQAAASLYIQSLNLYRGLDDRPNILKTLIRLSYLSGWADFGDGLNMFTRRNKIGEEALPLARELGDKSLLAQALAAFSPAQPAEIAKAMLEESATLAEECGDKATLAWTYGCMANSESLRGKRAGAHTLHKKALELYEEIGDKAGVAGVLFSMSIRAKRPQKRAYLERALDLQRELGAKKRTAEILMMLSQECEDDELELEESYNLEALELCRQFNSPIWIAGRLNRLAKIARKRGDSERADALEAESKSVYDPPPMDPDLEEALDEAFSSGDVDKMMGAVKRL